MLLFCITLLIYAAVFWVTGILLLIREELYLVFLLSGALMFSGWLTYYAQKNGRRILFWLGIIGAIPALTLWILTVAAFIL